MSDIKTKQRIHDVAGKPRHLNGWRRDSVDARDKMYAVSFLNRLALPAKASLRGMPGMKIEDQSSIGSCTCNSGTTGYEFVLKKAGVDIQLSRLYAYARVRQFEGTPLSEDSGAMIRDVMKVLAKWGCCSEKTWPYDLQKWSVDPPPECDTEAANHKATFYYRCPTLATVKASIAQGFPVVGGFDVPENMMSQECARTGIVKFAPEEESQGGHAVLFVGYDDSTKLLCFQNSWSEGWGDSGYGYLPYVFMTNGYADDFWTIRRGT